MGWLRVRSTAGSTDAANGILVRRRNEKLSPGLDGSMAKLDAGSMASLDGSMAQARWLDAQYCDHICDRHQASMARWLDGGLDGSMAASMARWWPRWPS